MKSLKKRFDRPLFFFLSVTHKSQYSSHPRNSTTPARAITQSVGVASSQPVKTDAIQIAPARPT